MSTAEMTRTDHWWPSRDRQDGEIASLNEVTRGETRDLQPLLRARCTPERSIGQHVVGQLTA